MTANVLFLLSAGLIAGAAVFLLHRGRPNTVLERIRAHRRRVSGAKTPPRSLSPERKGPESTEADYRQTFPPSRRFALANIAACSQLGISPEDCSIPPPDWQESVLPLETSYLNGNDSSYTPCGFSVKEIKALGDFPDYATLTGVPLPNPYVDFDITRALPRPYRPFRWAYHQTMCTYYRGSLL